VAKIPLEIYEHANADVIDKKLNTTNPATYTPTPEEQKTIKMVNKLFEKAKKYRKQYDQKWLEYYKFFRGKQWDAQRPSYRHAEVINMIFQNIQAVVPILTDSRPRLEFIPKNPMHVDFAQILNQVAASDWEDQNWLFQLLEIIYESHIYGTGFGKVEFDPKARFGIGSISFESADPFYQFPDPVTRQINDKRGKYYIEAEPVDLDQLKLEYPDKAKYLKPDLIDLMQGNKTDLEPIHFKSPIDNRVTMEGTTQFDLEGKNQALKITLYMQSDEFIEEQVQESNSQGGEPPVTKFIQKKKYPNGRKICMASGVILDDGPNPYEDGKVPFCKLINYPLPREFWGQSEIEQLQSPQKIFNKMVSFALDVLTQMGNPVWVVDTTSGIDTDNLFNRPGLVLEPEPNSRVERMPGVELQPYVLSLIDRMKSWFDQISGATDLSRGIEPKSVTAASAIEALQEIAQTRIRQKSRNIDDFLQDMGQLYLSRVFQFYSVPRIIRITGDDNAQKYFKFSVETERDSEGNDVLSDDGKPKRIARVRNYVMNEESKKFFEEPEEHQYEINGEFDVRISTGSSLPFARAQRTDESIALFKLGVIDDEELLKNLTYPNYEAVLQRMQQKREMMRQQQLEIAQAQGKQPMPGPSSQPQAG
jgi:hypothetical protein